jgi:hypothetical protein
LKPPGNYLDKIFKKLSRENPIQVNLSSFNLLLDTTLPVNPPDTAGNATPSTRLPQEWQANLCSGLQCTMWSVGRQAVLGEQQEEVVRKC